MQKITKGIRGAFIALCLSVPLYAASDAKEIAKKQMKALMSNDATYICQGDKTKANCVSEVIKLGSDIAIKNIKLDISIENDIYNSTFSFDVEASKNDLIDNIELLPTNIMCETKQTLKKITLSVDGACSVTANSYMLKTANISDIESKEFAQKDIGMIMEEFNNIIEQLLKSQEDGNFSKKYRINPKELSIELHGEKLGDSVFKTAKQVDSSYTKEQYIAMINMGVAMVPVGVNGAKGLSQSTIDNVSKVASVFGDILTSNKKYMKVALKRKNNALLDVAEFPKLLEEISMDPLGSLKYLNDYVITVVSD